MQLRQGTVRREPGRVTSGAEGPSQSPRETIDMVERASESDAGMGGSTGSPLWDEICEVLRQRAWLPEYSACLPDDLAE